MTEQKQCTHCKYSSKQDKALQCRRFPPSSNAIIVPTQSIARGGAPGVSLQAFTSWPNVEPTQWCGEFAARIELNS